MRQIIDFLVAQRLLIGSLPTALRMQLEMPRVRSVGPSPERHSISLDPLTSWLKR